MNSSSDPLPAESRPSTVAPEALTCDRIATAQGIPSRFLQAILGDLQHARLVSSQRGRDGGYRLALPASEISIARVMRVEQGFLAEVHGQRPEDVAYPGPAKELASVWVAAREAYRRVLEEVTLDMLAWRRSDPERVAEDPRFALAIYRAAIDSGILNNVADE